MHEILIPSQPKEPVGKEIVLENPRTHDAFFVLDGPFAKSMEKGGLIRHEINSAADYDRWAKRILQRAKEKSDNEDYLQACKIDERRKELRGELIARYAIADNRGVQLRDPLAVLRLPSLDGRVCGGPVLGPVLR